MSLTAEQIRGEGALGEQCIGADIFILQIQRRQQRHGHFDFIGALERIAIPVYGEATHFFCV
jgi:hypothetical protein